MSRNVEARATRAVPVLVAFAFFAGGCAPPMMTQQALAHEPQVETIDVLIKNGEGGCVNRITGKVKLDKDVDSLLLRFDNQCTNDVTRRITPVGLPISCDGAGTGMAAKISVDDGEREYVECFVTYANDSYWVQLLEKKTPYRGSELALEEIP